MPSLKTCCPLEKAQSWSSDKRLWFLLIFVQFLIVLGTLSNVCHICLIEKHHWQFETWMEGMNIIFVITKNEHISHIVLAYQALTKHYWRFSQTPHPNDFQIYCTKNDALCLEWRAKASEGCRIWGCDECLERQIGLGFNFTHTQKGHNCSF